MKLEIVKSGPDEVVRTGTIREYLEWKRQREAIRRRWQALLFVCVFGFVFNVLVGLTAYYINHNPVMGKAATVVAILCFVAAPVVARQIGKMEQ